MLILDTMLAKYFIIIYALGSVHEKVGVWIKKPWPAVEIPSRAKREERLSRSELR